MVLYGISIMIYGIIGIRLKEEGLDIKNFYTITVCLDLNNTVDSGIYYLEDNLKRYKSKIFLPLRLTLI